MARGITEKQVHNAADELVAAGERPTVDRIRQHLGTGSPNTVTRWLESWWQALGPRLRRQAQKIALPNAPEPVAVLASQLWEEALMTARDEALAAVAADRDSLEQDRTKFAAECEHQEEEQAALRQAAEGGRHQQDILEARLAEVLASRDQLSRQIHDLVKQQDGLLGENESCRRDVRALTERLVEQESSAAADRESQAMHLRAIEDRAHGEVDRARQEVKELRAQLRASAGERASQEQSLRQQLEEVSTKLAAEQREAGLQRGRADALEKELTRLGNLQASLQERLAQAGKSPRRRATKKAGPSARKRAAKGKAPR